MTPLAFFLILGSAGLHATWNMIAKKSGASLAFYAVLGLAGLAFSQPVRLFSPIHFFSQPPAFHAWLVGMLAAEFTYAIGLNLSYKALDMSTAYPMMRSLPLLFLAGITALFGFGKPLSHAALAGMAMVFAGCLLIPLKRLSDFSLSRYLDKSFFYILLVALGTTGYTLCDSQAQRVMIEAADKAQLVVSKPVLSLTYYCFRSSVLAPALWVAVLCGRHTRAEASQLLHGEHGGLKMALIAGVCSSMTYALVLVSMNFVSNVAYVQAFRQIGLLIGLAEGAFILHERCTATKVAGVLLILAGLMVSVL